MKAMNFSVSEQNMDVMKILDQVKNKSDYICQAIREKFASDQSDITSNLTDKQKESLRREIKSVLIDMFGENLCLFGSVGGMVVPTPTPATMPTYIKDEPEPKVEKKAENKPVEEKKEASNEDSDENLETLADIFGQL